MTGDTGDMYDLANLAKHVLARREALDLTQLDVWNAGGPSNSTLTAIESARPPAPSRSTLRKLDHALRWTEGSARAALSGGEPTPLDAATTAATAQIDRLTVMALEAFDRLVRAREAGASEEEVEALQQEVQRAQASAAMARADLARVTDEAARNEAVGAASKDADSLLYRRPDGVSDQEWARIRDQSRDYIEWLIDKAARER